jgi:hypothetical protein
MGAKNNRSQPSEVRIKYSNGEAEIDTPFTRDPHFYLENSYTPDGKPLNHSDEYKLTLTVDGAKTWLGTAVLIARAMEGNSTAKALEEKTQKKLISRLDIRNILARAAMGIAKWVDDESRDYGDKQVLDHVHFIRIIEKLAESEAKILLADDASLIFLDLVISYAIDLGAHVKTVELAAVESKLEAERDRNRSIADEKQRKAQEANACIESEAEKFCKEWKSKNLYAGNGTRPKLHPAKQEVLEVVAARLNAIGFELDTTPDGKLYRLITVEKIKRWCGLVNTK